jgi:chromosome segregation ATPase
MSTSGQCVARAVEREILKSKIIEFRDKHKNELEELRANLKASQEGATTLQVELEGLREEHAAAAGRHRVAAAAAASEAERLQQAARDAAGERDALKGTLSEQRAALAERDERLGVLQQHVSKLEADVEDRERLEAELREQLGAGETAVGDLRGRVADAEAAAEAARRRREAAERAVAEEKERVARCAAAAHTSTEERDELRRALDLMRADVERLRGELAASREKEAGELKNFQQQIAAAKEAVAEEKERVARGEAAAQTLTKNVEQLGAELADAEAVRLQLDQHVEKLIKDASAATERAQAKLNDQEQANTKLKGQVAAAEARVSSCETSERALQNDLQKMQNDKDELVTKLNSELEAAKQRETELERAMVTETAKVAELTSDIEKWKQYHEDTTSAKISELERRVSELETDVEARERLAAELRGRVANADAAIERAQAMLDDQAGELEKCKKTNTQLQGQVAAAEETLTVDVERIKAELADTKKNLENLQASAKAQANKIIKLKISNDDWQDKNVELQNRVESLNADLTAQKYLSAKLETDVDNLRRRVAAAEAARRQLDADLAAAKEDAKTLATQQKNCDELTRLRQIVDELRKKRLFSEKEIRDASQKIVSLEAEAATAVASLEAMTKERDDLSANVEQLREELLKLRQHGDNDIAILKDLLRECETKRDELQQFFDNVEEIFKKTKDSYVEQCTAKILANAVKFESERTKLVEQNSAIAFDNNEMKRENEKMKVELKRLKSLLMVYKTQVRDDRRSQTPRDLAETSKQEDRGPRYDTQVQAQIRDDRRSQTPRDLAETSKQEDRGPRQSGDRTQVAQQSEVEKKYFKCRTELFDWVNTNMNDSRYYPNRTTQKNTLEQLERVLPNYEIDVSEDQFIFWTAQCRALKKKYKDEHATKVTEHDLKYPSRGKQ